MAVTTSNKFGRINITDDAVAIIASRAAADCYGVVELVSRRLSDNIAQLFNKRAVGKGVKVNTIDNTVFIDIFVVLKLGVNAEAVKESLAKAVTYKVELYTGMRVKSVNINIVGARV